MKEIKPKITLTSSSKITISGDWISKYTDTLTKQLKNFNTFKLQTIEIDAIAINHLDFAGAWLLQEFLNKLKANKNNFQLTNLKSEFQQLLTIVNESKTSIQNLTPPLKQPSVLYTLGKRTVEKFFYFVDTTHFIGELTLSFLKIFFNKKFLRWRETLFSLEKSGWNALPIIGLLSFLIGVVLAYQMGLQLKNYGANIFIVDLTSMAILREFAPLITAIILAGRTGAAFTAEIGTMQIGEEISALRVMGLSPIHYLVIPKMLSLLIALPLLIIWADAFGCIGGMVMSKLNLNINYYEFISRFQQVTKLKNFFIGLIKAPVFAMIISFIGCYQGFKVGKTATSLGQQTTHTVVQSIFFIIVADAIFSIVLSWNRI